MLQKVKLLLLLILVSLAFGPPSARSAEAEDVGYLEVVGTHADWPAPEVLTQQLRSKDDSVRLQALRILGFSEQQAHVVAWSQSRPSNPIENAVVTPERIDLSYASLGQDASQEAVMSIESDEKQMTFAAVAIPTARRWHRIATLACWCKYDLQRALGELVQLRPAPEPGPIQHFELIFRASGGGTGIYVQNEGHFRVYGGELRRVMSFVSRRRDCDPTTARCEIERRWFEPTMFGDVAGGTLVTARGRFPGNQAPDVQWAVTGLEERFLGPSTCSTYKWDARSFQYVASPLGDPCKPRSQ